MKKTIFYVVILSLIISGCHAKCGGCHCKKDGICCCNNNCSLECKCVDCCCGD